MNCEILTFQFAHNYGAQLQCYALKKYIETLGYDVSVSDFIPDSVVDVYRLWPKFIVRHPKSFLKELFRSFKRIRQYCIFNSFIKNEIAPKKINNPDYLVLGSDQIWNEDITGCILEYYGSSYPGSIKISYAGSFGSNKLSDFQKENVSRFFNEFEYISLRESDNIEEVKSLSLKEITNVLDPVFLFDKDQWTNFAQKSKYIPKNKYILFYCLKHDDELINRTIDLSRRLKCEVIEIHPTCLNISNTFNMLYCAGPREFITLIKDAELICTNSFHAVAFSSIFGKKILYNSHSLNESRVPSILKYCGFKFEYGNTCMYDFSKSDNYEINRMVIKSKEYLKNALGAHNL